ncbi:envelope integrity protein Cei [Actinokineospora guangxiensis]|uniref:Envelope integrity protein Cei n=1 Tax=Actinokineospora guangxiensis TaxID=1490288 RepID=A0ABW0ELZ5_9PSEU
MAAAPRYRKRRPLPALAFLGVLAIAAGVVWMQVLNGVDKNQADARACPPSPVPAEALKDVVAPLGEVLPQDALDGTAPAPARNALVRVLNASGQNRQATSVTEALREQGFSKLADPDNDQLYPEGALACHGQIRFGAQGVSAARTLSLMVPCAELIRDDRQDATVDFAVGQRFDHLSPRPEGRKALEQLAQWAKSNPDQQGGLQANGKGPKLSADLLTAARDVRC